MSELRPFKLDSFEEEVRAQQKLVQARDILQAALAERDRIREEARREGLEKGKEEARELVQRSERERVNAETAGLRELLRRAAQALDEKRSELIARAERDLVKLALAIAEKIVKREVARSPEIAPQNVRRAIELTAKRQEVRLLVHPSDLATVEAYLPDLRREFSDILAVALEGAESVARGGCVVSTREGSVDATLETQLREIERGLLG
jgi:flagellar assembly protein FliH